MKEVDDIMALLLEKEAEPTDAIRWSRCGNNLPSEHFGNDPADIMCLSVSQGYLRVKRVIDILLAVLAGAVLSPVMIVAAVVIKLTSRGPVIFKQTRAGKMGHTFTMFKFRTMRQGADEDHGVLHDSNGRNGSAFKLKNDPRITSVGRFLRRTSIDELPQLLNVIRGDMSLVGPRPLPLCQVSLKTIEERARLSVKPGVTGLWQVSGRSDIPYDDWIELDFYYIEHRSTLMDLQILLRTVPAVLSCRGAY